MRSGLADAGPHDMQMLALTPFGLEPPESGLAVLGVSATRVFSRGRVTLGPGDPATAPTVEFRMLSDPRDRERLRDGYHRAVALVRHPAVAELADLVLAGQTPLAELEAPGALDRWMDENVTIYVHSVGSCRMGAAGDPGRRGGPGLPADRVLRPRRAGRLRAARRAEGEHAPHRRRGRRADRRPHRRAARRRLTFALGPGRWPQPQRSARMPSRTSRTKSSGCSNAAKCPPRAGSFQ